MDIAKIDKNFKSDSIKGLGEIDWYDIHTPPIKLYGAYDYDRFLRIDEAVAKNTNDGVAWLNTHTAGVRARFSTNSTFLAVSWEADSLGIYPNMPLSGSAGFDLYDDDKNIFEWNFTPEMDKTKFEIARKFRSNEKLHNLTLNFPMYNLVKNVHIGVAKGSYISYGKEYEGKKIVYYGSSITQGGCACRPGLSYQSIIARKNNYDYLNLGFSGSARGEEAIAEYIADLDMDVFVYDYDYNAPNEQHLKDTHERLFKTFRSKHPHTPVIIVSAPNNFYGKTVEDKRVAIIRQTYENAIKGGDKNVFFIDGREAFYNSVGNEYTVDALHPTEAGFVCMARLIGDKIDEALRKC